MSKQNYQTRALIQDTLSLEIREYVYDTDNQNQEFWWTEGNAACDCNRHLFFERALNHDYDDDHLNDGDGFPCGEGRYALLELTITPAPAESPPPPPREPEPR